MKTNLLELVSAHRTQIDSELEDAEFECKRLIGSAVGDDTFADDMSDRLDHANDYRHWLRIYLRTASEVWTGNWDPIRKAACLNALWLWWWDYE